MASNANILYGKILAIVSSILLIILVLSNATGILTQGFYTVFRDIAIVVTNLLWIGVLMESQNRFKDVYSFNEVQPDSGLSRMPLYMKVLLVGGILAFVFSAGAIGLKSPIIDVPQPFAQEALALVPETYKVFFQSVIPGFFEEATVFIIAWFVYFTLKLVSRNFMLNRIIAVVVGASVLTFAHAKAYGSDQAAYLGIFLFEAVVQFFNLYTGGFISWLPHITHNAVVSLNFLVAFSLGGTLIVLPFLFTRRRKEHGSEC